jgi:hypothetical protein
MSQTYSTRQRDQSGGKLFSSRYATVGASPVPSPQVRTSVTAPAPTSAATPGAAQVPGVVPAPAPAAAPAAAPAPVPEQVMTFALTGSGLPVAGRLAPGGAGTVTLRGRPGQPWQVSGSLTGLVPPGDPALQPTLWLIHDLVVPSDLDPADRVRLPRGSSGTGNQPGAPFTLDGNPPTYGMSQSNTLSIAMSPGVFAPGPGGVWQLAGAVDAGTNQAYHPLVVLGPSALSDINVPLPTGVVARALTDLFMRPATVHPELNVSSQFPQRLTAVVQAVLAAGTGSPYLTGEQFTRAAVTLEGLVRGTPRLMPTRETCFLAAQAPVA